MTGTLILAHGSRRDQTEQTLENIAGYVRKEVDMPIETAFMQFRDINLEKGLDKLVKQGCTDIKLIPYFLFEGVHITEDIPKEIASFTQKNPGITISLGKTLGDDPGLARIVADRIREMIV